MTDYGKVQSTVRPESVVIDDYSVWINSNINAVNNEIFEGYEYNQVMYGKDEYIIMLSQTVSELTTSLNDKGIIP